MSTKQNRPGLSEPKAINKKDATDSEHYTTVSDLAQHHFHTQGFLDGGAR